MGLRIGVERFYHYFQKFGLLQKTGVDLPGEAATIMHDPKNMGPVELATVSFGQSFQVTPIQLLATTGSLINGGLRVTPHFAKSCETTDFTRQYEPGEKDRILSEDISGQMARLLENVVSKGGGNKAYIEGYSIGGKTATSQTLPRSANKYISAFMGFCPVNDPQVMVLVVIHDPKGVYYGGTIAAPIAKEIFADILPYLGLH